MRRQENDKVEQLNSDKKHIHSILLLDGPKLKLWVHISKRKNKFSPIAEFSSYNEREIEPILWNKKFIRNLPLVSTNVVEKLCRSDRSCAEGNEDLKHNCESWCWRLVEEINVVYPPNDEKDSELVSLHLLEVVSNHPYSLDIRKSMASVAL
jgi:hypothetical protein